MHLRLTDLDDRSLADILLVQSLSRSSEASGGSCTSTLKALKWLHRMADVPCLSSVDSPLVHSFLTQKIPHDRKQAPPLPLWTITQWERRVLMSSCPLMEVIILGSFLVMFWASLRFSDAQRIALVSLVFSDENLRGTVWRSKSSVGGLAFGILTSGFLSVGGHNWVWKFLQALDRILATNAQPAIDFLLPDFHNDQVIYPLVPMEYASALYYIRKYVSCPWQKSRVLDDLALNYTVHSLKATMLAWGPQIASHTSKEQRLQQGHHADPQNSLEVYSRDHVWGALQFQQQVLTHVRRGWRPHIAQHRGAQQPLQEPSVHLEKFSQWFQFTSHPSCDRMDTPVVDPSSSSSSSSDSDSSSDAASIAKAESKPQVLDQHPEPIADEILVGQYRSVLHAMVLASDEAAWRPEHEGQRLKPACGRPMRANETTILHRFDPEMQLCQHGACRKIWLQMHMI
eukprot:Skav205813  [mRNA]  locus=scaffold307:416060:417427:+ [translate_table: standard]